MQETQVQSLTQQDPVCCGATKPLCLNYQDYALEPGSHSHWRLHTPEPDLHNQSIHRNEKATYCDWRTAQAAMKTQHSQK